MDGFDGGLHFPRYLVECALGAGDSLNVPRNRAKVVRPTSMKCQLATVIVSAATYVLVRPSLICVHEVPSCG